MKLLSLWLQCLVGLDFLGNRQWDGVGNIRGSVGIAPVKGTGGCREGRGKMSECEASQSFCQSSGGGGVWNSGATGSYQKSPALYRNGWACPIIAQSFVGTHPKKSMPLAWKLRQTFKALNKVHSSQPGVSLFSKEVWVEHIYHVWHMCAVCWSGLVPEQIVNFPGILQADCETAIIKNKII